MDVGILESSIIAAVTDDGIPLFCFCFFFSSFFGLNLMCRSENDKVGGLAVSACSLTCRVMVIKWEMEGQVSVATIFPSVFHSFFSLLPYSSYQKLGKISGKITELLRLVASWEYLILVYCISMLY